MSLARLLDLFDARFPAETASAHCDGPCGVYDPASARIAAEAVLSMTKKIEALDPSDNHTFSRYVAIKEEEAEKVKRDLEVLWSDYFKPEHLEAHPDLHTAFWEAVKAASAAKVECKESVAAELLSKVEAIHHLFWATKGRDVPWVLANP